MEIDAVITWVDGNDPSHRQRMQAFGAASVFSRQDVAGDTRYASLGEIFWCVASLNRFAPFLRRIFLVTDGQDPHLEPFLEREFPEGYIPVEIVDHKVVFAGYENYLPVFNSIAIETMQWRIPGLSEHFIMLNDDFMLAAPVTPADFFTPEGWPVCYAERYSLPWARFTRAIKPRRDGRRKVTFKGVMLHAADMLGQKGWFLRLDHTPRPLLRSFYEQWFAAHPESLVRNIRHRFRDADQFSTEELQYLSLYRQGRCRIVSPAGCLFFLQPKHKFRYVERKMARLRRENCKFCCFNSLDLAAPDDRRTILSWISSRLDIAL
ncbi:MAG: Stealth CR1 domain-containing protein [Bacteroidales bacterium]|nr:Stealth CR1 domain-containing protein [Bacteroidales bacterium]